MNVFVYVVDVQQEEYRSRTEPCGTPDVTSVMSDRAPLTETRCLRFDRKDVIQLCVLPVIPYEVSLDRRRLCGTLSKALAKSRRIASICVLLSTMPSSSHGLSLSVETPWKEVIVHLSYGAILNKDVYYRRRPRYSYFVLT